MQQMKSEDEKKYYVSKLYDLSDYNFERATLGPDWDQFVNTSPYGTIYSNSSFLSAVRQPLSLWRCYKKSQLIGQIVTGETQCGSSTCRLPFVVYSGIIVSVPGKNTNPAQLYSENFRLTSAALIHLNEIYETVELAMCPQFEDMRPFQWFNYNTNLPKFKLDLRYTSYVTLQKLDSDAELEKNQMYINCSKSRRQEIRYGLKSGLVTKPFQDIEEFLLLYKKTFLRQSIDVSICDLNTIRSILESLYSSNQLYMWGTYTSNRELANVCVFGLDSKRAYYLFGASDPALRNSYAGTYGLFQSLNNLSLLGVREVDLEGVNSPSRGYFKLSFGGSMVQYYWVTLHERRKLK